ncbi:TonB-dependent receptor [Pedobacter deserti]|uniref:TonB-dependent receptor n=1 Tax=Pedobacter deserti TaxID=2817382 RepID=UPI00210CB313|nr:TonB-dependent receptor [Pedobacter sp. SYSU D00382]
MLKQLLCALCVVLFSNSFAQAQLTIGGNLTQKGTETVLPDVQVQADAYGRFSISNEKGRYLIRGLKSGHYTLTYKRLGFQTVALQVNLRSDTIINLSMEMLSLGLKEVPVVARQSVTGSSSLLEKTAIQHTQPASLADALQLIPGQLAVNPDLSAVAQINLRQVPSSAEAARANALGTALVLDGIPLSNNANMQTTVNILNAAPGTLPAFASVAGRGNDLRQIPADQIESIEVIRGVPSARYGDLTSGAIVVATRAGVFAPEFTTRVNPNLIQQSAGLGVKLGANAGIVSFDGDLASGNADPRDELSGYSRFTSQFAWTKPWLDKQILTTTRLSLFQTRDTHKQDPADQAGMRKYSSKDRGFRLSSNGKYAPGSILISYLSYDAGLSYTSQESFLQERVVRDVYPVTDRETEGRHVARFGDSEYLSQVQVSGRPMSIYGRLEAGMLKFYKKFSPRNTMGGSFIAGAEYRHDVNRGAGRQFDALRPPRQNYSTGDRPRSYAEVPAISQLAYYLEGRSAGTFLGRNYSFHAGLRCDDLLVPRINLAVEAFSNLRLKAGYGLTAKSPTLSFLYPGPRYYDLQNFNYYAANPAERLVVLTTHVRDLNNERLKAYTSRKAELGADYKHPFFRGYVTAFIERTRNAFGTDRDVQVIQVDQLRALEFPVGQPPVLDPVPFGTKAFFAAYDMPVNNRQIENRGFEFQLETKALRSINTSFDVSGAWIRTQSYSSGDFIDVARSFSSAEVSRIGIFSNGYENRVEGTRFNTSLRFITRIPAFKFLFSGLVQTVWMSSNENYNDAPDAIGFLDNSGRKVYLSRAEARSELYKDLEKRIVLTGTDFQKPLWLFNVRATKEFSNRSGLSFYINNIPGDRGLFFSEVRRENIKRNQDLFFGAEFTIKI